MLGHTSTRTVDHNCRIGLVRDNVTRHCDRIEAPRDLLQSSEYCGRIGQARVMI